MKKFALILSAVAAIAVATPALAADAVDAAAVGGFEVSRNDRLYDATGRFVGDVKLVTSDNSVVVIYRGKTRRIAAETLSRKDGKLTTSLERGAISKLD